MAWRMMAGVLALGMVLGLVAFPDAFGRPGIDEVGAGSTGEAVRPATGQWVQASTGLEGGSISSLVVSPSFNNDQTVFAGTDGGGIFKSANGGQLWRPVNGGLSRMQVTALAISPRYAVDHVLFAGTSGGLFRTTNDGASWTDAMAGVMTTTVSAVALSPNYAVDHTVFAGGKRFHSPSTGMLGGNVWRSTDGGDTWQMVHSGASEPLIVKSIVISPAYAIDRTVIAAAAGRVCISHDGGNTWTDVGVDLVALAMSPAFLFDHTVYGAWFYTSRVYKSTDGGLTWTLTDIGTAGVQLQALALSSAFADDHTLFTGGLGNSLTSDGLFRSRDGGGTWSPATNGLTYPPVTALAMSPGFAVDRTIFAGTQGGGVYTSIDGGATWTAANHGLTAAVISSIAVSPAYAGDHTAFAGGAGIYKTTDGGQLWAPACTGLSNLAVTDLAVSPTFATDHTVFASTAYSGGIYKSVDGGATWVAVSADLSHASVLSLGISPHYALDQTIYAGVQRYYLPQYYWQQRTGFARSTDGGASWQDVSTGPGADSVSVVSIVVSPAYAQDRTVFAAAIAPSWLDAGGIYRTTDAGGVWFWVWGAHYPKYGYAVDVSADYAVDHVVFAAADSGGTMGVFRSADGGDTWDERNSGLPPWPGNYWTPSDLKIVPLAEGGRVEVVALPPSGVFTSRDEGATWQAMSNGLPNRNVTTLADAAALAPVLFAGTKGSGIWRYTFVPSSGAIRQFLPLIQQSYP